jgi:hypothetical protein
MRQRLLILAGLAPLLIVFINFISPIYCICPVYPAFADQESAMPSIVDENTQVEFIDALKSMPPQQRRGLCGDAKYLGGEAKGNAGTIKEALGAPLKHIEVLWTAPFETRLRFQTAVDAIADALQTSPKQLYRYQPWANQVLPEFIARLQYADGKTGEFEMAYGYVCFQDAHGIHWWTRFTDPSDINLTQVRGKLQFDKGYQVSTGGAGQIWLKTAEDKELLKKLQTLTGKNVIAKGQLRKVPKNVTTSMPRGASYLKDGFTIEANP